MFAILVAAFIGLASVAPLVAVPASAAPIDTIYSLVNQARFAAGLHGLVHNPSIDAVAAAWANQMGERNSMEHNPNFTREIPAGWTRAGENIAEGYPTPQAMFDGWMHSPPHRANILGEYTDIGIAFVTVNGKTWGVQDFGKYPGHVGPAAPAPAPAPAPSPAPVVPVVPKPAPSPSPSPSASPSPSPSASPSPSPSVTPSASAVPSSSASAVPLPASTAGVRKPTVPEQVVRFAAIPATLVGIIAVLITLWSRLWAWARRRHTPAHRQLSADPDLAE